MKKVCILLSTYNGEKYLEELLCSIAEQSFWKNGEISILVRDDGSTDGTFEILEPFISNSGIDTNRNVTMSKWDKDNYGRDWKIIDQTNRDDSSL